MKYSNQNTNQVARFIPSICATCFAVFSFLYLYFFQSSLLAQEQYVFSHGQTSYNPLYGALLCTFILLLVGFIFTHFFAYPLRAKALAWLPSSYLLGVLTCMHFSTIPSDGGEVKWVAICVIPFVYLLLLFLCFYFPDKFNEKGSLFSFLISNSFILIASFLLTIFIGNTGKLLHAELQMAALQYEGKYSESLLIGKDLPPTRNLTGMRVNALMHIGDLGGQLFQYPICISSDSLLPSLSDTSMVYGNGKETYRMLKAVPYKSGFKSVVSFLEAIVQMDTLNIHKERVELLLCAYLIDKDLNKFDALFSMHYPKDSVNIPLHFREAIQLKQCVFPTDDDKLEDTELKDNFTSFLTLTNNDSLPGQITNKALNQYRNTYWYYYYYSN